MDCKIAQEQLSAWADGEAATGLEDHLRDCPECAREADFLRSLKDRVRGSCGCRIRSDRRQR